MRIRVFFGILALAFGLSTIVNGAEAATTEKKAKVASKASCTTKHTRSHRVAHVRHHYRSASMIPPPPAYMPCVLPELYARNAVGTGITEIAVEKKVDSPYKKYVQTPAGDAPEPLQQRKGVSTWSNRS